MEFLSMGLNKTMGSIPLKFLPSQISGLQLWTRFNSGITVTGSGVSQWDDQSGNDNHLTQSTDANRPSKEADGSILFDGVDNFLAKTGLTLNQPHTVYLLFKQVTWTDGDVILGFGGGATRFLGQSGATPQIKLFNGTGNIANSITLDTYAALATISNGASSVLQVNNDAPVTGETGSTNASAIQLGTNNQVSAFSHIQVKEAVVYDTAHDAATRAQVIKYLADVGDLSI